MARAKISKGLSQERRKAEGIKHTSRAGKARQQSDNARRRKGLSKSTRHAKSTRKSADTRSRGTAYVGQTSAGKKVSRKKASARTLKVVERPIQVRRTDIHPLDRAIAELRAELARTPDDATLLGRLGALFYRRGDLVEAEKHYRRAIETSPRRPTLYNNLGNVLCDMGRMRDGIAAYEHAIALERAGDPQRGPSQEALVNLELAQIENRLVHERIEYLERAAQLEVSSAEALNALGCGYLLRGKRQLALEIFRKAAELDPRNRWAALNIAYTHALNMDGSGDLAIAQAEIAESILRFPHEPRLHIHQGELLENAGLLEEAEERYLRALEADPRCLEAYDLLGRIREATGMTGTADDIAKRVNDILKELDETARARRKDGVSADDACALFDLALVPVARSRFMREMLPQPAAIDVLLREAVHAVGTESGMNGAMQDAREAAVRSAILRAQLFESDGRRDEARLVLDNAAKSGLETSRLCFERAALSLRCGDVDQAVANFDRATLAAPQDATSYQSLRFAFEGYRRYRSERVRFDNSSKANPRDGLPHHHMALASLSVLKHEEALFHFTRALELDPRLSDAACGRGRALQRLGHLEEAEAAYVKALDIDPENAEAHRSLMNLRTTKLGSAVIPASRN